MVSDGMVYQKEDVVILFSGGADSTLLIEIALKIGKRPLAVMIDYGQLHKEELEFGKKYLQKKALKFEQVTIQGYSVESALTGHGVKGIYEGVSQYNVPARNTIFIAFAYGIAEANGITEVWYGPDYSDYLGRFPDCYQSYVAKMGEVLEIAGVKPIKLYAPLLGFTKEMVIKMLMYFGIQESELYSGYGEFS